MRPVMSFGRVFLVRLSRACLGKPSFSSHEFVREKGLFNSDAPSKLSIGIMFAPFDQIASPFTRHSTPKLPLPSAPSSFARSTGSVSLVVTKLITRKPTLRMKTPRIFEMKGNPCVCPEPVLVIYRFSFIKEIDHRQTEAFFFSLSPAGCCQLQWVNRRAYVVQRLCALAIRPPELDLCV